MNKLKLATVAVLSVLASFMGILPFSFLAFNYFYHYLLPIPAISVPLDHKFHHASVHIDQVASSFALVSPNELISNVTSVNPFALMDENLSYSFYLQLSDVRTSGAAPVVNCKASIVKDSLITRWNELTEPKEMNNRRVKWPVSYLSSNTKRDELQSSFVTNFDTSTHITPSTKLRDIIPRIFHCLVPEVALNYTILSSSVEIEFWTDFRPAPHSLDNSSILIEFDQSLAVDPHGSKLVITTSWDGIYYYLFHYKVTSYVIGTLVLWLVSSSLIPLTIIALTALESGPKRAHSAKTFYAADNNIGVKLTVE